MLHSSRKRWLSGAAIVAMGAIVLTACASERDGGGTDEASDVDSTFVFARIQRSRGPRPRIRQRRRDVPRLTPDLRGPRRRRARHGRPGPAARRELGAVRGRAVVHVHAEGRREVPRRHRLQRRGGLLQLRPLVQLDRARAVREPLVLLRHALQGLRRHTRHRGVRLVHGRRRHARDRHADAAVRRLHRRAVAAGVLDAEPDGARGVRRRRRRRHRRGADAERVRRARTRSAPVRSSSTRGSRASRSPCRPTRTTGASRARSRRSSSG